MADEYGGWLVRRETRRSAPFLVTAAWAEFMDAVVETEERRNVVLPEVALVACRCILVPIGQQAVGTSQQLVKVLPRWL